MDNTAYVDGYADGYVDGYAGGWAAAIEALKELLHDGFAQDEILQRLTEFWAYSIVGSSRGTGFDPARIDFFNVDPSTVVPPFRIAGMPYGRGTRVAR